LTLLVPLFLVGLANLFLLTLALLAPFLRQLVKISQKGMGLAS
jgi:hypothetical protein